MLLPLNGATRIHVTVGDPIAQVKSPAGITQGFAARGKDAIMIPLQVKPADVEDFFCLARKLPNLDGIVITVPHKFAALRHCERPSERSRALAAVNVMRRERDGTRDGTLDGPWAGDMTDGIALVAALRAGGFAPQGRRALVVGAGGAGSAVVLALADAGARVAVHDTDAARREDLRARLRSHEIAAGSADPAGFDLVVNATPLGMTAGDPLPVAAERLAPTAYAADLVTRPVVTPFLDAARRRGSPIVTGEDMFAPQAGILADFLLSASG